MYCAFDARQRDIISLATKLAAIDARKWNDNDDEKTYIVSEAKSMYREKYMSDENSKKSLKK